MKPVYSVPLAGPAVTRERAPGRRRRHGEPVEAVEDPVVVAGRVGRREGRRGGRGGRRRAPPVGVKVSRLPGSGVKLEKKWPEFGWP